MLVMNQARVQVKRLKKFDVYQMLMIKMNATSTDEDKNI